MQYSTRRAPSGACHMAGALPSDVALDVLDGLLLGVPFRVGGSGVPLRVVGFYGLMQKFLKSTILLHSGIYLSFCSAFLNSPV